jgi:hypothetical protein
MLHAYRLVYPDSPHAPETLWEWERPHIARLLWNATAFGRALTHRYFPTWEALAQENQRIWETYYLPRPLEFIPIKPSVARVADAPGSCAGHSTVPSPDRGRPPSTGGSGL